MTVRLTPEKQEILQKSRAMLERIGQTLTDMENGLSEAQACRRNSIDKLFLRRVIYQAVDSDGNKNPFTADEWRVWFLTPEEQLYCDLMKKSALTPDVLPSNLDDIIPKLLSCLTPSQRTVLKAYYYDRLTFAEIAEKTDTAHQYVNATYKRAMFKLRKLTKTNTETEERNK